jgi:glutamate synthase (NADPH/NADH) small chain
MGCGVPFCQSGCPLGNHIPDWLMLAAEGRLREAYELSAATSSMPEVCGRICPQDRLCEGACVIEKSGHGTVTIGAVEQFITETAFAEGWVEPIRPETERGQSVGIIGAGPAGLTAAERLRALGYAVTVYDRYDRAGGLLGGALGGELPVDLAEIGATVLGGALVRGLPLGRDEAEHLVRSHPVPLLVKGEPPRNRRAWRMKVSNADVNRVSRRWIVATGPGTDHY